MHLPFILSLRLANFAAEYPFVAIYLDMQQPTNDPLVASDYCRNVLPVKN